MKISQPIAIELIPPACKISLLQMYCVKRYNLTYQTTYDSGDLIFLQIIYLLSGGMYDFQASLW